MRNDSQGGMSARGWREGGGGPTHETLARLPTKLSSAVRLFEQQNSRTTEEYNNKNNARGRQTLISFEVEKVYRDLLGVGRDAYFDLFAAKGRTKSVCVCERERERERASERARERERELVADLDFLAVERREHVLLTIEHHRYPRERLTLLWSVSARVNE